MDTYISDHKQFGFYGKTNGSIPRNENKRQLQIVNNDKRVLEMGCRRVSYGGRFLEEV